MIKIRGVTIQGKVVQGEKFGRKLGFPTANLDRRQWIRQKMKIPHGVYGGQVKLPNGKKYKAGIVIGPLDKRGLPKLEAHLIGFKGNLYGKRLTFYPTKFIRKFTTYQNEQLLKQQIKKDIAVINKMK